MTAPETVQPLKPRVPFAQSLLARAGWVLVFFTILLLFTFPAPQSDLPDYKPSLVPVQTVLVLGAVTWLRMLLACVQEFRVAVVKPSIASSVAFFFVFGWELFIAASLLRHS